jgi:hypothetical protein
MLDLFVCVSNKNNNNDWKLRLAPKLKLGFENGKGKKRKVLHNTKINI